LPGRPGRAQAARCLPPDLDDLPAPRAPGGGGDRGGPAPAQRHPRLPHRRLAGAGGVRHVRDHLRRPPEPHPDPHAGRLGGVPAAQGLPTGRHPGRVPRGRGPAPGPAEVVPVTGPGYAPSHEAPEGRVFTVTGGDCDQVTAGRDPIDEETIIVNMGPQHPSTHGVLRLVLELEGETVTQVRPVVGYLHTGIEKNLEFRTWTQGTTFVTRMDYLSPIFNETAYCLAVEKLLGISDQIPERATVIRVLMMELNRIASHLVWVATTGMELGALSIMTYGFREREKILDIFEMASGLRMNHAYIRPGGVAQDF